MSQENVELVTRSYEAWNAEDRAALAEFYDPGAIIARQFDDWPEQAPAVGRDAVLDFFRGMYETFQTQAIELLIVTDAGDRVITRHVWRGSGHGPELHLEATVIFTLRNGRIFLVEIYRDHTEALEAVELEE